MVNEIGQNFGTSFGIKLPNISSLNKKKIQNIPAPMTPAPATDRNTTPNLTASKLPMQDTTIPPTTTGYQSTPGYGVDFDTLINRQMEDLQAKASKTPQRPEINTSLGFNIGIPGINKPAVPGVESTQISNAPVEVKQSITNEISQQPQQEIQPAEAIITDQSINDLYSDIKSGMPIEELSNYYPEYEGQEEMIKDLKADIESGMPEEEIPNYYPELSQGGQKEQSVDNMQGGLKGGAARTSPIDLGPTGEALINPIGRVAEIIDNATQKIPTFTGEGMENKLKQRISNISEEKRQDYVNKFNNSKIIQKLYGDVDTYIQEENKTFFDQLFGTAEKGPNFGKMVVNAPASAVKTVTAIARGITNPVDTLAGLGKIIFTKEGRELITQRYGSRDNFAKTLETDPVGVASDVLSIAEGGANLVKLGAKAAGLTKLATTAGKFSKAAGIASDLGLRGAIPSGLNKLQDITKVADNAPLTKTLGKVVTYGVAMTKPLDTFVEVAKKVGDKLPTAEGTIQRMNRLTASDQRKFFTQQGKTEGQWLNDNIGPKTPTETVYDLGDRIKSNLNKVDSASDTIKGSQKFEPVEYTTKDGDVVKYEGDAIKDMGEDAVGYAERTGDPRAKVMRGILEKYNRGQAEFSDINKLHRYYQANTRMGYFKDLTAGEKTVKSTNIDSAVREWKIQTAIKNGFDNLREINKDTQASMFIVKALEKAEQGRLGNNAVTLTDWIVAAPAMLEPSLLAGLVTKKLLQSNWFTKNYAKVINKINGHQLQADKAVDLAKISKFQTEKEFQNWLNETDTQGMGLPYKKGMPTGKYDIDTRPITVTPEGQSFRKGQILEKPSLNVNKPTNVTSNPSSNSNPSNPLTKGQTKLEPLPNKNNPLVKNKLKNK